MNNLPSARSGTSANGLQRIEESNLEEPVAPILTRGDSSVRPPGLLTIDSATSSPAPTRSVASSDTGVSGDIGSGVRGLTAVAAGEVGRLPPAGPTLSSRAAAGSSSRLRRG